MLSYDDKRWRALRGGYRTQFDPRPLLLKLERGEDLDATWRELWNELHHQGDVGEASYAAVPHLVRIVRKRKSRLWNTFALVAIIELARGERKNPEVPVWMKTEYLRAIQELAKIGASELIRAKEPEEVRAILSILAISRGARTYGRCLINYSEEEWLDLETRAFE